MDTFTISEIANIMEDKPNDPKNGVFDYGKFNEGYCIRVSTKDSFNTVWIICTDTDAEKDDLLNKLRTIKIQDQHERGMIILSGRNGIGTQQTYLNLIGREAEDATASVRATEPIDGYWLTLQDWSQCSKKCDGGISTFHRMCIPPKNGGKPCVGQNIITKKCNPEPCPLVDGLQKAGNTTVNPPIMKIMPYSNSPQRYSLCKIKESDLMIYEDGKDPNKNLDSLFKGMKVDNNLGIKIPCRVVMNTKTLSVFAGERYENLHMSFNLAKTRFFEFKEKKNCFKLYENPLKYIKLCPYSSEVSRQEYDEWSKDFETFKTLCDRSIKEENDQKEKKALDDKINDKMDAARKEAIEEAKEEEKVKRVTQTSGDLAVLVKNTNSVAMKAIQKEQNLEELIKQEAEEKNQAEEEKIMKMIAVEKKKKDCVLKAIRQKELENSIQEKEKEIQDTINTIKQEAAAQVLQKRNNLRKILNQINQKAALKRSKLRDQLVEVRMSIADEIGKAFKKGDINKCVDAMTSPTKRYNYCIAFYAEDFSNLNFCKQTDDFCTLCCKSQFGEIMSGEKQKCIEEACNKKSEDDKEEEKGKAGAKSD